MIRLEDKSFEDSIFEEENCIAVPFEASVGADGTAEILVYSFAEETARIFENRFGDDPFSDEAGEFLLNRLSPVMNELGYETAGALEHGYAEYGCTSPDMTKIREDCELIDTLEGEKWPEELSLDEFELSPENRLDRMAVIRRDGQIVCYAGVNDLTDGGVPELTVECDEKWRQNGFAASCTAKLAAYLIRVSGKVTYACALTNTPSVKTAEAAGFTVTRRVMPFVCYRKETEEA